jgi:transcriptional regulator with XRE-family HTH domain
MATKSQHSAEYQPLLALLRALRKEAELTQRDLGERLDKPQSWIHNCEVGNRRVDVSEFVAWATACGAEPPVAFARFLSASAPAKPSRKTRGKRG